jgi:hypothetical protein
MKVLNSIKKIIGLALMIGIPLPILFADKPHEMWYAGVAILCSIIGTGFVMGFDGFKTRPEHIGNTEESGIKPRINQTWMMFFISLVITLLFANMF